MQSTRHSFLVWSDYIVHFQFVADENQWSATHLALVLCASIVSLLLHIVIAKNAICRHIFVTALPVCVCAQVYKQREHKMKKKKKKNAKKNLPSWRTENRNEIRKERQTEAKKFNRMTKSDGREIQLKTQRTQEGKEHDLLQCTNVP